MLDDIEKLAQKYTCCIDCYWGYDNYDQQVFQDVPEVGISRPNTHLKKVPRFDKCKIIELKYRNGDNCALPAGVINCVTLVGYHSKCNIFISYYNLLVYYLKGSRNMCFIPNSDGLARINIYNFTGIIRLHYVKFSDIIENSAHYKICQIAKPRMGFSYLKFAVYKINKFNHSEQDLQIMWNYVYPGRRPKNKFLVYFRPMPESYYRSNIDWEHMIYYGTYNNILCGSDYSMRLMFGK